MKAPASLTLWSPQAATTVATLQVLYLLGVVSQERLHELHQQLAASNQPDSDMAVYRLALEHKVYVHTVSPFDPQEIQGENGAAHLREVWRLYGKSQACIDAELSESLGPIRDNAIRAQQLADDFPGQYSRESRQATVDDLRSCLDNGHVVCVAAKQVILPRLILPGAASDECLLYRPEFDTTTPASTDWAWRQVAPALTVYGVQSSSLTQGAS